MVVAALKIKNCMLVELITGSTSNIIHFQVVFIKIVIVTLKKYVNEHSTPDT